MLQTQWSKQPRNHWHGTMQKLKSSLWVTQNLTKFLDNAENEWSLGMVTRVNEPMRTSQYQIMMLALYWKKISEMLQSAWKLTCTPLQSWTNFRLHRLSLLSSISDAPSSKLTKNFWMLSTTIAATGSATGLSVESFKRGLRPIIRGAMWKTKKLKSRERQRRHSSPRKINGNLTLKVFWEHLNHKESQKLIIRKQSPVSRNFLKRK